MSGVVCVKYYASLTSPCCIVHWAHPLLEANYFSFCFYCIFIIFFHFPSFSRSFSSPSFLIRFPKKCRNEKSIACLRQSKLSPWEDFFSTNSQMPNVVRKNVEKSALEPGYTSPTGQPIGKQVVNKFVFQRPDLEKTCLKIHRQLLDILWSSKALFSPTFNLLP